MTTGTMTTGPTGTGIYMDSITMNYLNPTALSSITNLYLNTPSTPFAKLSTLFKILGRNVKEKDFSDLDEFLLVVILLWNECKFHCQEGNSTLQENKDATTCTAQKNKKMDHVYQNSYAGLWNYLVDFLAQVDKDKKEKGKETRKETEVTSFTQNFHLHKFTALAFICSDFRYMADKNKKLASSTAPTTTPDEPISEKAALDKFETICRALNSRKALTKHNAAAVLKTSFLLIFQILNGVAPVIKNVVENDRIYQKEYSYFIIKLLNEFSCDYKISNLKKFNFSEDLKIQMERDSENAKPKEKENQKPKEVKLSPKKIPKLNDSFTECLNDLAIKSPKRGTSIKNARLEYQKACLNFDLQKLIRIKSNEGIIQLTQNLVRNCFYGEDNGVEFEELRMIFGGFFGPRTLLFYSILLIHR